MPKILCKCGAVIENISIPNPNGYLLISENALDRIETEECNSGIAALFDRLADEGVAVYLCPDCERLIIVTNGQNKKFRCYAPEA